MSIELENINYELREANRKLKRLETQPYYDRGLNDYISCRNFNPLTEDEYEIERYREGWSNGKKNQSSQNQKSARR